MASNLIKSVFVPMASHLPRQSLLEEKGKKIFYGPDLKTFFSLYRSPIGIEVEVEGFKHGMMPKSVYWKLDEDGSLKDDGAELISVPVAGKNIDFALMELEKILSVQSPRWSHRCSIHIHINVRNWTVQQVRSLVMAYAVFEDLFFSLVPPERKGGAYTYPIRDIPPDRYNLSDEDGKYCALNVGTSIRNYGTVEFRHMHGTGDIKTIRRWIQLIVKLHSYVRKSRTADLHAAIQKLNTNSEYFKFVQEVFGQTAQIFDQSTLQRALEEGVLWAKVYSYCCQSKGDF